MLIKHLKMLKDKFLPKSEDSQQESEFEIEDEEEPANLQAKRVDNKETGIVPPPAPEAPRRKYRLSKPQRPNAVAGVRG